MWALKLFIRENFNMAFGLNRHVTINALADVVGGPDPNQVRPPIPSLRDSIQDALAFNEPMAPLEPPIDEFDAPTGLGLNDGDTADE